MLVQKLRLKRGWSQSQLAQASGLSTRTVQRVEAGYPASIEPLKSLAAVFEVDFSTLNQEATMAESSDMYAERKEQEVFKQVRKLRGFYIHLMQYVAILIILTAINLIVTPHRLWVLWVAAGWGVGVLFHALRVFSSRRLLGPEWERREVEKRLGRSL